MMAREGAMPICHRSIVQCVVVALPLLSGGASVGHADGFVVGPHGSQVWEPGQAALILIDETAGTEDLFLEIEAHGEARDFGWIVPTPALPQVAEADEEILRACDRLTRPIHRRRSNGFGCAGDDERWASPADGADGEITIYDEQTIGILRTLVLGADDAELLADSLRVWGYLHAENESEVSPLLEEYVARDWYFVATRVDSSVIEPGDGFWSARVTPLRLTFATDAPVYPLRISSISATQETRLRLYVCARTRMRAPGTRAAYANRLDRAELANIREDYPALGALLAEGRYLTKLVATLDPSEMTGDLYLTAAASEEELRPIEYAAQRPGGELLLLAAAAGLFVFRRRRKSLL
ncbi:MAG: DUF2330 domain-containing protein [Candidatus Eisenbacteria bacterium]|nr:DUF2330 domain-containing protein [Candidatus Eisenbacteria bacterium]